MHAHWSQFVPNMSTRHPRTLSSTLSWRSQNSEHRNRRLIRDGEKGGRGYGGGERGRLCTYHYTVTTRMTSALRWAAMRDILMFVSLIVRNKVTRLYPQTTTFLKRKDSRSSIEPRSFLLLTSLTPYRSAKPAHVLMGRQLMMMWSLMFLDVGLTY